MEINKNTRIDVGMPLSKNFLLEHVSSGAYHPLMASWAPKFSSALLPNFQNQLYSFNTANIPLWKVVRNLQIGSDNILENLLNAFGGDLRIQAGFLNNVASNVMRTEGNHTFGMSFDVQVNGYEDNMYTVAKEIQKAAYKASNMELVFSGSSWMHLDVNPNRALSSPLGSDLPSISTRDISNNIVETGITSIRGFV